MGVPGLDKVADVTVEQFSNKASGAITPADWRAIATRIDELFRTRAGLSGVVVTHGTDTMEETAYFLDLTVRSCRPVVVTGAMRRATDVGADGPANLYNAVRVAAAADAVGRGAVLLMNDEIFPAREVTKINTSRMDAFEAPSVGALGVADPDTVVFYRPAADGGAACTGRPAFDLERIGELPRVDIIYSYPGADGALIDAAVNAGAKGLVIAGVGRGGMTPPQGQAVRRAVERGVTVVSSSRTMSGRVPVRGYDEGGTRRPGAGAVLGAGSLTPQKARILLMLALAAGRDPVEAFAGQ